jgi:hypothetical protein
MLRLDFFSQLSCKVKRHHLHLPLEVLTIDSFPFTKTTAFPTFVPAAVQINFADSQTMGRLINALVADSTEIISSAAAFDRDNPKTWKTIASMADLLTRVSASQSFPTRLFAISYGICAGGPWRVGQIRHCSLSARTMSDRVRRSRTVWNVTRLGMAGLLASMLPTIHYTVADLMTVELSCPIRAFHLFL